MPFKDRELELAIVVVLCVVKQREIDFSIMHH